MNTSSETLVFYKVKITCEGAPPSWVWDSWGDEGHPSRRILLNRDSSQAKHYAFRREAEKDAKHIHETNKQYGLSAEVIKVTVQTHTSEVGLARFGPLVGVRG